MVDSTNSSQIHVDLKTALLDLDGRISNKFKFSSMSLPCLDDTVWSTNVREALMAVVDLVVMADRGNFAPGSLRKLKAYRVVVDNLRELIQDIAMIRLGEDAHFAFALERGFEELLTRECKTIQAQGTCSCKIRFVKPRTITHDGVYPIFERITIRFDGQFEVSFIDNSRYGT
jgi:hypothetical protein